MQLLNYDITTKQKVFLGHQYDHNATRIRFNGFNVENSADSVYLRLDKPLNLLIPLTSDLKFTVQSNVTCIVGAVRAQLVELRIEDGKQSLVKTSPIFYCMVGESLSNSDSTEVTDPSLDLIYAEIKRKYEELVRHEETASASAQSAAESAELAKQYASGSGELATALSEETAARESADESLQKQITAIGALVGDGTGDYKLADVAYSGDYNDLINKPSAITMHKLTIGDYEYDGSEDVEIPVYEGEVVDNAAMTAAANDAIMTASLDDTSEETPMTEQSESLLANTLYMNEGE